MNDPTRTNIENWLTYAEELGLAPFYRDRAITGTIKSQSRTSNRTGGGNPGTHAEAETIPSTIPAQHQPPRQINPPPHFSRSAAGPTLFEAADRIEGDTLEIIRADLGECTRCKLHKTATK